MSRLPVLAATALAALSLSGCIAVHDGRGMRLGEDSCSVQCARGGRAEVTCAQPRIPACHCEPEVAAACVSAHRHEPSLLM